MDFLALMETFNRFNALKTWNNLRFRGMVRVMVRVMETYGIGAAVPALHNRPGCSERCKCQRRLCFTWSTISVDSDDLSAFGFAATGRCLLIPESACLEGGGSWQWPSPSEEYGWPERSSNEFVWRRSRMRSSTLGIPLERSPSRPSRSASGFAW